MAEGSSVILAVTAALLFSLLNQATCGPENSKSPTYQGYHLTYQGYDPAARVDLDHEGVLSLRYKLAPPSAEETQKLEGFVLCRMPDKMTDNVNVEIKPITFSKTEETDPPESKGWWIYKAPTLPPLYAPFSCHVKSSTMLSAKTRTKIKTINSVTLTLSHDALYEMEYDDNSNDSNVRFKHRQVPKFFITEYEYSGNKGKNFFKGLSLIYTVPNAPTQCSRCQNNIFTQEYWSEHNKIHDLTSEDSKSKDVERVVSQRKDVERVVHCDMPEKMTDEVTVEITFRDTDPPVSCKVKSSKFPLMAKHPIKIKRLRSVTLTAASLHTAFLGHTIEDVTALPEGVTFMYPNNGHLKFTISKWKYAETNGVPQAVIRNERWTFAFRLSPKKVPSTNLWRVCITKSSSIPKSFEFSSIPQDEFGLCPDFIGSTKDVPSRKTKNVSRLETQTIETKQLTNLSTDQSTENQSKDQSTEQYNVEQVWGCDPMFRCRNFTPLAKKQLT